MNLDKESMKKLRQLILFTIVILIALWNYNIIFGWIRFAFGIIFPFLLGGAIAFVLNVPMNFLEEKIFGNRYLKEKKIAKRLARPVCLVLTIAIVIDRRGSPGHVCRDPGIDDNVDLPWENDQ